MLKWANALVLLWVVVRWWVGPSCSNTDSTTPLAVFGAALVLSAGFIVPFVKAWRKP